MTYDCLSGKICIFSTLRNKSVTKVLMREGKFKVEGVKRARLYETVETSRRNTVQCVFHGLLCRFLTRSTECEAIIL